MEEKRHHFDLRYLLLQYGMEEISAWLIVNATSVPHSSHCIKEALDIVVAYNNHRGHLDHGQRVHMSQGGDDDGQAPLDEQQPEQLLLAEKDSSEASGLQPTRPRRSRICFKPWEVRELESLFQFTQYPDVFAR